MNWDDLNYWSTGEWQVCEERLSDMDKAGKLYCPKREDMFSSLDETPFESVKVVILGQDPYPRLTDATGLAFSVPKSVKRNKWPGSLNNLLKEYVDDLGYEYPKSGDLSAWANRGVLLWNSIPTVTVGKPGSHKWVEYEPLTIEILETLSDKREGIVFVLMGGIAQGYRKHIDEKKHRIVTTVHPSPLSANRGFFKCRLFSTVNAKLREMGKEPIDWKLP